jgi:ubiquinone/menaquinone biosynthesis C-methylase UbiE
VLKGYELKEVDMKPLRDPEGNELSHLVTVCELADKDILEVGCGDGKFTRQYAKIPRRIVGIDPEISDLHEAMNNKRPPNSFFIQSKGEQLPFPPQVIDIVIFASSL